jgi:hypothetical protein
MARKADSVNKAAHERDLCAKHLRAELGDYADIQLELKILAQYLSYCDWTWGKEMSDVIGKKEFEKHKSQAARSYLDACENAAIKRDAGFFRRMALAADCLQMQKDGITPSGRPEVARTAFIVHREWALVGAPPGFLRVLYALDAEFPQGSGRPRDSATLRRSLKTLGIKLPSGH